MSVFFSPVTCNSVVFNSTQPPFEISYHYYPTLISWVALLSQMLLRNGHGLTIRGNKNENNVDHHPGVYRVGAKQWTVDLEGHTEHSATPHLYEGRYYMVITWVGRIIDSDTFVTVIAVIKCTLEEWQGLIIVRQWLCQL